MRVILVHGINTRGESSTDRLGAALVDRGVTVVPVKYRPVRFWNAPWRASEVARTVLNYTRLGDAAIGHSFGCLVLYRAMEQGAEFGPVTYFGAAMEQDVRFPCHGMTRLLNVTNPYDKALSVGSLIPFKHPFGRLGSDGYAGVRDDRIKEVQSTAEAGKRNHTAPYFSDQYLDHWAQRVYEFLSP